MKEHNKEIRTEKDYQALFLENPPDEKTLKKAHKYALDIRKFEIELYWKRAAYFWTLIVASFAAFFTLKSGGNAKNLIFLVSCIGLVLSTGWYLVNRGSKYWQVNWERHVDLLEEKIIGPLYKTTIAKDEFPWKNLVGGYPYSVSKINQLISLFITLIWVGLALFSFPPLESFLTDKLTMAPWAVAFPTVASLFFLLIFCRGEAQGKPRRINFRSNPLDPTDTDTDTDKNKDKPS